MKKIGFVDYYIGEWHANSYPAWIKKASEAMGEEFVIAYAWAEEDLSPIYNTTTSDWCEKFGAEKCETLEELCEKSDYIVVLAPSNPEKHLGYAEKVLTYGKNTYIDKTFAPDLETAEKIFEVAKKYGTKFFSTSALRFGTELVGLEAKESVTTTGGGGNLEEYIIHQVEMVIKLLRADVISVKAEREGTIYHFYADFEGGKKAKISYDGSLSFAVGVDGGELTPVKSNFFQILLADVLRFFVSGETAFDVNETLQVMKLRDAILKASKEI